MSFALKPRQNRRRSRGSSLGRGHRHIARLLDTPMRQTPSAPSSPSGRSRRSSLQSVAANRHLLRRGRLTPANPHAHILSPQRLLAPRHTLYNAPARSFLATTILAATIIWWIDWLQTQFRLRLGANWSMAGGAGVRPGKFKDVGGQPCRTIWPCIRPLCSSNGNERPLWSSDGKDCPLASSSGE